MSSATSCQPRFPSSTQLARLRGRCHQAHGYKRAAIADCILHAAYVAVPLRPR